MDGDSDNDVRQQHVGFVEVCSAEVGRKHAKKI